MFWGLPWWLVKWIAIALLGFLFAKWMQWRAHAKAAARRVEVAERRDAVGSPDDHFNTICVGMWGGASETETAQTLHRLFDAADCPWRISVALVTFDADAPRGGAAGRYRSACEARGDPPYKVRAAALDGDAGALDALEHAERALRQNERFWMTAAPDSEFVDGWDTRLVTLCTELSRRNNGRAVITALPFKTPENGAFTAAVPDGSFCGVRTLPLREIDPPERWVPALLWTPQLTFALADVCAEVPLDARYAAAPAVAVHAHSARLYTSGWDLVHPTAVATWCREPAPLKPARFGQLGALETAMALLGRERCAGCGVARTEHGAVVDHGFVTPAALAPPYTLGAARLLSEYERHVQIVAGAEGPSDEACHGLTASAGPAERRLKSSVRD